MSWVLKNEVGSTYYFKQWTAIGPSTTPKVEEAAKFITKEQAMQSPAYSFPMTFFRPFEVKP